MMSLKASFKNNHWVNSSNIYMLAIRWTNLDFTCRIQNFGVCSDASMTIESGVM